MQPAFRIEANRQDITDVLKARLLALQITDEAGTQSDRLELQLDDRDFQVAWPQHGAILSCWLGYEKSALSLMGDFTIDEIGYSGPPSTLIIRGKATDMRRSLKKHKTRHWEQHTLGELVAIIAAEHDLTPKVSTDLVPRMLEQADQTEESDLHFLTRLAKNVGAIAKPAVGYLLFVSRGEARAATGQSLPIVDIPQDQLLRYQLTHAERGKFQTVRAYFYETEMAQQREILIGTGEPVYTLRHPYTTEELATQAAQAKLKALTRGTATVSFSTLGNPALLAEGRCRLTGIRAPVNGEWVMTRVEHRLDTQGFMTQVEASTPNR